MEKIGDLDFDTSLERFDEAVTISNNRPVEKPVMEALPIDKYREDIIHRVERDRVTIIHGETGCGKSSRVPQFLLEDALAHGKVNLHSVFEFSIVWN